MVRDLGSCLLVVAVVVLAEVLAVGILGGVLVAGGVSEHEHDRREHAAAA